MDGPGRFGHSAIQKTIAPWDGPAIQLYLSEQPVQMDKLSGPFVSFRVYKEAGKLSKQTVRLEEKESRAGVAFVLDRERKKVPLSWAEIEFEEIREGAPVTGKYEVAFPDGKKDRGRFQAVWWKAEGPGG